jgi:trehalose synthase
MTENKNSSTRSKLKFSEYFFPARPQEQFSKAKKIAKYQLVKARKIGLPLSSNPAYVSWLKQASMLEDANRLSNTYAGKAKMWRNPYAKPQPRTAIMHASVWFTAYPASLITRDKESIISAMADEDLWRAFQDIGIEGLHTGPMKQSGGVIGWKTTPSVDGHFDRISTRIDPIFGTNKEFTKMTEMASKYRGIIIDDIIPGHTGKGADFRLAEMAYDDYPGIYHMVEIAPEHWHVLPEVESGRDCYNISTEAEEELKNLGYIVGKLQRIIFYEKGIKETNWSATKIVRGVDGVKRRWVYLHYFKEGQPSINWIDPTFAGMRLVIGDALHSIGELGSKGLRLDANGFLGVEINNDDQHAWSEGHPLSEAANHIIASMVRKLNGFTFQELNLTFEDIQTLSRSGADLSYDFINRPSYHHALATGDTEFLRLTMNTALELGVDPASLVHALQNHDDLTYELVHFWTAHKDDDYEFRDQTIKGLELRRIIQDEMRQKLIQTDKPYNLLFTENGIACTSASAIAAILGVENLEDISAEKSEEIKRAHLLLAMFNALQPGVFALSGWDLVGALTLDPGQVADLISEGDTRWINRGAFDLLGNNPDADKSASGMPKAKSLYGCIPDQLNDDESFIGQLKNILAVRKQYGIARSYQLEIADIQQMEVLGMIHRLRDGDIQVTLLNFSGKAVEFDLKSEYLTSGKSAINMFNDQVVSKIDENQSITVGLEAFEGLPLLIDDGVVAQ